MSDATAETGTKQIKLQKGESVFVYNFQTGGNVATFVNGYEKVSDGKEAEETLELTEEHITEEVIEIIEDTWGVESPCITRDMVSDELAPNFRRTHNFR